jgi:hypothetical protein
LVIFGVVLHHYDSISILEPQSRKQHVNDRTTGISNQQICRNRGRPEAQNQARNNRAHIASTFLPGVLMPKVIDAMAEA